VINTTKIVWRPVTSAVPQGSILSPTLLKIFINNLDDWTESKFADNRESGGLVAIPDDYAALQRHNLEK